MLHPDLGTHDLDSDDRHLWGLEFRRCGARRKQRGECREEARGDGAPDGAAGEGRPRALPRHLHARPKTWLSRAQWRARSDDNAPDGTRHSQLPWLVPGVFILASGPKPSKSCSGMIASSPTEPSAARFSTLGIDPGVTRR